MIIMADNDTGYNNYLEDIENEEHSSLVSLKKC